MKSLRPPISPSTRFDARPFGPLSVYWHDGPYGDAIESENGIGVGWFSSDGSLPGEEFDDVEKYGLFDSDAKGYRNQDIGAALTLGGG